MSLVNLCLFSEGFVRRSVFSQQASPYCVQKSKAGMWSSRIHQEIFILMEMLEARSAVFQLLIGVISVHLFKGITSPNLLGAFSSRAEDIVKIRLCRREGSKSQTRKFTAGIKTVWVGLLFRIFVVFVQKLAIYLPHWHNGARGWHHHSQPASLPLPVSWMWWPPPCALTFQKPSWKMGRGHCVMLNYSRPCLERDCGWWRFPVSSHRWGDRPEGSVVHLSCQRWRGGPCV